MERLLDRQDTVLGEYGDPLSLNLYAYVKGNPLTYVDPAGHAGKIVIENSAGGSNDRYVAYWLVRLEYQAINQVLHEAATNNGKLYIPYSAYDVADQMGIDHDVVERISTAMVGEEQTNYSQMRYEQLAVRGRVLQRAGHQRRTASLSVVATP